MRNIYFFWIHARLPANMKWPQSTETIVCAGEVMAISTVIGYHFFIHLAL